MYLSLVQIAESFGVSERLVQDWVKNDGLPHVADHGYLLFDRGQVAKWAAGRGLAAQAGFLASEKGIFTTEFDLETMLRSGGIWRDVPADGVCAVFEKIVSAMSRVPEPLRALLVERIRTKRGISWAPAGDGFALPHFATQVSVGRDSGAVALILLREPLPLPEPPVDSVPVTRLLFFVPPSPRAHLDLLGRLARLLTEGSLSERIARRGADEEIFRVVAEVDSDRALEGDRRESS